ncbi:hypothetical protein C3L33_11376, partial [Rhododendron williamsianum]
MADETAINGAALREDDGSVEVFVDFDETNAKAAPSGSTMAQKIEALEQEKRQLVHENDIVRERIDKLKEEIKGLESDKAELKREVEQSGADKRALESISARAYTLETEVSRLQHDLITSVNEGEEAGREIVELRREVEGLKERASRAEVFEKERDLLLERVDEREDEVRKIRKVVEDREALVAKKELEVERVKKERDELEGLLEEAERKGREMEEKVAELRKELEAREKIICGLKERAVDLVNGSKAVVVDGEFRGDGEDKGLVGLKVQWPVVAAAAATGAAIGAGAVLCYVRCFPFLTVRRWGGDRIPLVFSATSRGGFLCSAYKVARQFSVLLFSVDD